MDETTKPAATPNQTTMQVDTGRTIIITRRFNARAATVFEAWTSAALVKRWWAPKSHGVSVVSCEADVRVGGRYRYVLRHSSGEIAFSGEYREVTPPTRLCYTQVFEPMADAGAVLVTLTLEEQAGKTLLVATEVYPSRQAREAALSSGMEHGMRETLDQLDELVASLR